MRTLLFGAKPSAFLSIATTRYHAKRNKEKFLKAAEIVERYFYVDDLCSGDNNDDDDIKLYQDLTQLTSLGGFRLAKWISNSQELMRHIPEEDRSTTTKVDLQQYSTTASCINVPRPKALRLRWNPKSDTCHFDFDVGEPKQGTKRELVSLVAKLYDPLGLLSPFTVRAKLMTQDLEKRI